MKLISKLGSSNIITIPALIARKLDLSSRKLVECKILGYNFISLVLDRNKSFGFVIPNFIIKKLNLKLGGNVTTTVKLYKGKVKNRKELAILNINLFLKETDTDNYNEENYDFSRVEKQMDNYDFSKNKILLKIKKFYGKKYKFVRLPKYMKEQSYIIFRYNNMLFIRKIFQKNKLSVPTRFYSKDRPIEIIKVINKGDFFKKPKSLYLNYGGKKFVDIKGVLPKKILINESYTNLIVKEFPKNQLIIYYDLEKSKGKVKKPFIMDRYIPLNTFIQFLGFYFGDGLKKNSNGIGGINSEKSVIIWLNKVLNTYFKEQVLYEVVHGYKKLDKRSEISVKRYWSKICKFDINKINYNKSNKNPKKYGSLRIHLNQIISRRLFNYFLRKYHILIKKDSYLAKLYLRGLGMSDMGVSYKNNKLSCIVVGHQKDNKQLRKHYKEVLLSYGINKSLVYGDGFISIYNIKNYISFINDSIFKDHWYRKSRLMGGFSSLENGKNIKNRLAILKKPLTAEGFRKAIKIKDDPYNQLGYLKSLNLVHEVQTYPKLYIISEYGKRLLKELQ